VAEVPETRRLGLAFPAGRKEKDVRGGESGGGDHAGGVRCDPRSLREIGPIPRNPTHEAMRISRGPDRAATHD